MRHVPCDPQLAVDRVRDARGQGAQQLAETVAGRVGATRLGEAPRDRTVPSRPGPWGALSIALITRLRGLVRRTLSSLPSPSLARDPSSLLSSTRAQRPPTPSLPSATSLAVRQVCSWIQGLCPRQHVRAGGGLNTGELYTTREASESVAAPCPSGALRPV